MQGDHPETAGFSSDRRSVSRQARHASQDEFEDLIIEIDDISLIAPAPHSHPSFRSMGGEVVLTALRSAGGRRRTPG